ncbi:uncharacterized protein Dvar_47780 [Desulfosarcina variabilis str. Montpellier]
MIEGYTKNEAERFTQWNELKSFISYFEMPFYIFRGTMIFSTNKWPSCETNWLEKVTIILSIERR